MQHVVSLKLAIAAQHLLVLLLLSSPRTTCAEVVCNLEWVGQPHAAGLLSARLACHGGSITAAAHPTVLSNFTNASIGVIWSNQSTCGEQSSNCLLTVCGNSSATFPHASVVYVRAPGNVSSLVCITGGSTIEWQSANFSSNNARALTVVGSAARVVINNSTFALNSLMADASKDGGALSVVNSTVLVQDSTFLGQNGASRGGSIAATGAANLTVVSATFQNNTASYSGGSICLQDSATLTAVNTTWQGGNATYGAALALFYNSTAIIRLSTFLNNAASASGGAVYTGDSATLNVTGGVIGGNKAASEGGGLAIMHGARAYITGGSLLADNQAVLAGGAARVNGDNSALHAADAVFSNNSAWSGGAVCGKGRAAVVFLDSSFKQNRATSAGGSISILENATLDIRACNFSGNSGFFGGGISIGEFAGSAAIAAAARADTRAEIQASSFQLNRADDSGGALFAGYKARVLLHSCVVQNNTASAHHGGGLLANGSIVSMTHTNLSNNLAGGWGGALYANSSARVTAVYGSLTGNTASAGGAVTAVGHAAVVLNSSEATANAAGGDSGGVFCKERSRLAVHNSTIAFNTAGTTGNAGGIGAYDTATVILVLSNVTGNKAMYGGGMRVLDAASLIAHSSNFASNAADVYGGAIIGQGQASIFLSSCSITNNTIKTNSGGCLTLFNNASAVLVGACKLLGNRAGGTGGCIYLDGTSRLNVSGATFAGNSADTAGGTLYLVGSSSAVFGHSSFTGPDAFLDIAGGVAVVDKSASLSMASCLVANVSASRGAGIASFGNAAVHLDSCTLQGLKAVSSSGGAVLVGGSSNLVCTRSAVRRCSADQGGGVYVVGTANVTVLDSNISDSVANFQAGGIWVGDQGSFTMTRSRIDSCTALNQTGGGLFVGGSAQATVTGCNISNCKSMLQSGGGVVVLDRGNLSVTDCRLNGNFAALSGGALAAGDQSRVRITASDFGSNTCGGNGGAVALDAGSTIWMDSSLLHDNAANGNGGGVAMDGLSTLRMPSGVHIVNNTAGKPGGGIAVGNGTFNPSEMTAAAQGNHAPQGENIWASPTRLSLIGSNGTVDGFVSRLGSEEGLLHVVLNVSGAQGLPAEAAEVAAVFNGALLQRIKTGKDGIVRMSPKLRQPPGTYKVTFGVLEYFNVPVVNVTVHVVNCSAGDVTVSTGDACQTCVNGYFSLDPHNSTCDMCVPNAECPGGAVLWPLQGFWHSAPTSLQMHRCFNPSACLGGVNNTRLTPGLTGEAYKTAQCAEGYQGNLCGKCQPGFGTMKTFVCRKCMHSSTIIALYALAALAMLGVVKLLVSCTLAEATAATTAAAAGSQAKPVDLLKPLVVYAQWLFIVSHLNGVPWPPSLLYPLQAVAWFWSSASGSSLGLDCVLPQSSAVPDAMQKVLFGLCMPLAILLVLLCLEVLLRCFRQQQPFSRTANVDMVDRLASLLICIVFLFLPTWTRTVFSLFACVPLDQDAAWPNSAAAVGSFWSEDLSQVCYAQPGYHRPWALGVGIPLVVLLCFVLPTGLFAFMWLSRKRGKLSQDSFRKHYGFLYRSWRKKVCWWEAVVVLQTIVLVMISTFGFVLGPYYQSLVITAALSIVAVLLLSVKPHRSAAAGRVWIQGIGALFLTAFSALTFLPYNTSQPGLQYSLAMGVVVLVVNVVFVVSVIWRLLRLVDWASVRNYLLVHMPGVSSIWFARFARWCSNKKSGWPAPSRHGSGHKARLKRLPDLQAIGISGMVGSSSKQYTADEGSASMVSGSHVQSPFRSMVETYCSSRSSTQQLAEEVCDAPC